MSKINSSRSTFSWTTPTSDPLKIYTVLSFDSKSSTIQIVLLFVVVTNETKEHHLK